MQLQSFEQGVERMVGGVFQRAFKSSVRPIHIGRKLIRAIDAERTVDAAGKAVAPNVFVVHLNEKDRAAFGDLEKPLVAELVGAAEEYAKSENYSLLGAVQVSLFTDAALKSGRFEVEASVSAGVSEPSAPVAVKVEPSAEPPAASIVPSVEIPAVVPPVVVPPVITPPTIATPSIPPLPTLGATPSAPAAAPAPVPTLKATLAMGDGSRIALRPGVISVGRSAESTIPLNDTNVSRRHAELRLRGEGADAVWVLVDLGSTNGTLINGVKVNGEQVLRKNDAIVFGATKARYEVA
ncbi:MAG: DUF3662 and FHA domain-containing protein [Ilumatobacteraceae bacterium]|nr:DUF3662 and FHA domain-containing protein [Ilumatobacteraceae bacterium]